MHINGWNAIQSIGKRTCKTAQWEIRRIAKEMARQIGEVAPEIGRFSKPQGILYGHCPERENCGYCEKKR
jgi:thymidylate synthase ThyX